MLYSSSVYYRSALADLWFCKLLAIMKEVVLSVHLRSNRDDTLKEGGLA